MDASQAVNLVEASWQPVGPDLMLTGYLPSSGGLAALHSALSQPVQSSLVYSTQPAPRGATAAAAAAAAASAPAAHQQADLAGADAQGPSTSSSSGSQQGGSSGAAAAAADVQVACFYKPWDRWGALSNFSPHPIVVAESSHGRRSSPAGGDGGGANREWPSVEHYYQAQKMAGVDDPQARSTHEAIAAAASPEEAARIGRAFQRASPHLMRPDWDAVKVPIMYEALCAKFTRHAGPRQLLLSTAAGSIGAGSFAGYELVEASPNDLFWGTGFDGSGRNQLGKLLMQLRAELAAEEQPGAAVDSSISNDGVVDVGDDGSSRKTSAAEGAAVAALQ